MSTDSELLGQSGVSHAPCLNDDPDAPEGGIPCCSGCACTCGSDFPFSCECMGRATDSARGHMTRAEATNIVRSIFRRCGYAVGEHGTRGKDLDLMAMPWTDRAGQPHLIAEDVAEALGGQITVPAQAGEKPHGRLVWTIVIPNHAPHDLWYVDLSVMAPVGYELPLLDRGGDDV